ncbi:hypothetical protein ZP13_24805 [Salmonella enterica subsp. enterica]|nr:hypothetical protein [Salmonella enterica]ECC3607911.1 hypothetical protein [Salmonella enterica subsp. enterica]EGI6200957.1 hypothetical protein [Salmonella enterica subsp. enterica serovar Eastbourne]ECE0941377.1 hypothetical protein [Salmonella enterica subsp. enterica]ECH9421185.1 hypothetical protein [Salmonella enterica subsp. enterica]
MTHLKCSGLILAACWLLAGCAAGGGVKKTEGQQKAVPARQAAAVSPSPVAAVRPVTVASPQVPVPAGPSSAMENCSRELTVLKRLNTRQYTQRKAQFDRLMSGASVYAEIRTDVAGGTREAVDAMYRFRTGLLCAEISRDVLDALARQGEDARPGSRQ